MTNSPLTRKTMRLTNQTKFIFLIDQSRPSELLRRCLQSIPLGDCRSSRPLGTDSSWLFHWTIWRSLYYDLSLFWLIFYISGCCLFPNHTGTTHTHDQWRQLDLNSQTHKGHPPRTREEPLPAPLLPSDHRQSQRGERQDGKGKNRRGPSKIRKEENEISFKSKRWKSSTTSFLGS